MNSDIGLFYLPNKMGGEGFYLRHLNINKSIKVNREETAEPKSLG